MRLGRNIALKAGVCAGSALNPPARAGSQPGLPGIAAAILSPLRGAPARSALGAAALGSALLAPALSPLHAQSADAGVVIAAPPAGTSADAQPSRDMAANGTPVVRIARPNARGTSYNAYDAFNVDQRGLILNNSADIVLTQLGGYIDGNGNLVRSGPASLIINEVTGTNRSFLGGFIEIAGAPAELVIANPYGISCNGCGFINAPRVSLAAGTAQRDGTGALTGFNITTGTLAVGGAGLNASDAQLDLFARAITLNAGVWAESINAAAGAGTSFSDENGIVVTATSAALADPPVFALDVAALGGMYARSIRLIGTEAGLGVNVDGRLAAFENGLVLDVDGTVRVGGTVTSEAEAAIASGEGIQIDGLVYSDGALTIAGGAIVNEGLVASGGYVTLSGETLYAGGTLAAGLARDGTLGDTGTLTLIASGVIKIDGRSVAGDAVALSSDTIEVNASVEASAISAEAVAVVTLGEGGALRSAGSLDLGAQALSNAGVVAGQGVTIEVDDLANGGRVEATDLVIESQNLLSNAGSILSTGALAINAGSLTNQSGDIVALGEEALGLTISGALASSGGTIGGNGDVIAELGSLDLSGEMTRLVAADALELGVAGSANLTEGAAIAAGGATNLAIGETLTIERGLVQADALNLASASTEIGGEGQIVADVIGAMQGRLDNSGLILTRSAGPSQIVAGDLVNTGTITSAAGDLALASDALTNEGVISLAGGGDLNVTSSGALGNAGTIASNGSLLLLAGALENQGALSGLALLNVSVVGEFTNSGSLESAGSLSVTAQQIAAGGEASRFEGGTQLNLNAETIALGDSTLLATSETAGTQLTISASGSLTASSARIGSNGLASVSGASVGLGSSEVTALGTLSIRAEANDLVLGDGALVASGADLSLFAANRLDGSGATISAEGLAGFEALQIALDEASIGADQFAFTTDSLSLQGASLRHTGSGDFALTSSGTLDYSGAQVFSAGTNFTVEAATLINRGGALEHAGSGAFSLSAGAIDNVGGTIATNGSLSILAQRLDNRSGIITALVGGEVTVTGTLDNSVDLGSAQGQAGAILSAGALQLSIGDLSNEEGTIEAGGLLSLSADRLSGRDGRILALGEDALLEVWLANSSGGTGLLGSQGDLALTGDALLIDAASRISAAGKVSLLALDGALTISGTMIDGEAISLAASNDDILVGGGALVVASQNLGIAAQDLSLTGAAVIEAGEALNVEVQSFVNDGASLQSLGSLTIGVEGALTIEGGTIFAGGAGTISAGDLSNASSGERQGLIVGGEGAALTIEVADAVENRSIIASNGALDLSAQDLNNEGGLITALGAGDIAVTGMLDNAGGTIQAATELGIDARTLVNSGLIAGDGVTLALGELNNLAGRIEGQSVNLGVDGALANSGVIQSAGALDVSAVSFANHGDILALDTQSALTLTITDALTSTGGTIGGNGDVNVSAGSLLLEGEAARLIAGNDLFAETFGTAAIEGGAFVAGGDSVSLALAGDLDVAGGTLQADRLTIASANTLVGSDGVIAAGTLTASQTSLTNAGQIALGTIAASQINADRFINSGLLSIQSSDFAIAVQELTNSGTIAHAGEGALGFAIDGLLANEGAIGTNGALAIAANQVVNTGDLTAVDGVAVNVAGALESAGTIITNGDLSLVAASLVLGLDGSDRARLEAGGALGIAAGDLTITDADILALGDGGLTLDMSGGIALQRALLGSNGALSINASQISIADGQISALGNIAVDARDRALTLGGAYQIASEANVALASATLIEAASTSPDAVIAAAGEVSFTAPDLVLDGSTVQGESFVFDVGSVSLVGTALRSTGTSDFELVSAGTLDYSGAEIYSAGENFTISAAELINVDGALLHAGSGVFDIDAATIDNRGGEIATNGSLALEAGALDNRGGLISTLGGGTIAVTGTLDNSADGNGLGGLIASSAALRLDAGTLINQGGAIEASGALDLTLGSLDGAGGQIAALGESSTLNAAFASAPSSLGLIASQGDLTLSAPSLALVAGDRVTASGAARITGISGDIAADGAIIDAATLELAAASGAVRLSGDSLVLADQTLSIETQELAAQGNSAIEAGSALTVISDDLRLTDGIVQSLGTLDLDLTGALASNGGTIFALGAADIVADSLVNAADGLIASGAGAPLSIAVAGAFDNSDGTIASNDTLGISGASLANRSGVISAIGDGMLDIEGLLDNSGGIIQSNADLAIAAGQIANAGGSIDALGTLSIDTQTLDNGDGSLIARSGSGLVLSSSTGPLALTNDAGGLIASVTGLSIDASTIDNGGALFGDALTINAATLTNLADAGISGERVTINATSTVNSGEIAGNDLRLSGNSLTNAEAALIAGGGGLLEVDIAAIANRGIIASGSGGLLLIASTLDNDGGALGGGNGGDAVLNVANVSNGNGVIAADGTLAVTGTTLSNGSDGALWADGEVTLTFTDTLTNFGTIGSGSDLTLTANVLENAQGILASGGEFSVDFNTGTLGELFSIGDVILSNAGDYTLGAGESIITLGLIEIDAGGVFTNQGTIESAGVVTLSSGGDFTNTATGSITGGLLTIDAGGTLTNDGLINGERIFLTAEEIENAARIFGSELSVTGRASITNSGANAVIASRSGLLGLYSDGAITNEVGALLYSLGSIEIGGVSGERAASLLNSSARIEAQDDIVIRATNGVNERTLIEVGTQRTSDLICISGDCLDFDDPFFTPGDTLESTFQDINTDTDTLTNDSGVGEIIAGGSIAISGQSFLNDASNLFAGDDIIFAGSAVASTQDDASIGGFTNQAIVGTRTEEVIEFDECLGVIVDCPGGVNRTETIVSTTTSSETILLAPAIISAGGTVSITAPDIANVTTSGGGDGLAQNVTGTPGAAPGVGEASDGVTAEASDLSAQATNITGTGVTALDVLGADGVADRLAGTGANGLGAQSLAFGVDALDSLGLAGDVEGRSQGSAIGNLAGADLGGLGAGGVDDPGADLAGATASEPSAFANVTASSAGLALAAIGGDVSAMPAPLMLDLSGLFGFAPPGSNFLIETDPAFTDFGNFLSSDFFLTRLGYDPTRTQQRLGDGLYEQKLIADQLTAQAGVGRLARYASAEDQYRALMDAGITYMQEFSLALGVGLTAEQMATLTSDIVLLVEVEVETPDGIKTVLAPKVYLTQVNQRDLTTGGAVIAGNNIQLRAANSLINTGSIAANVGANLSANDILNQGRLDLGAQGSVVAGRDLVNRAGTITGGDVSLRAGRDLSLESVATTTRVATQWDYGKRNFGSLAEVTTTNRTGSVAASGDLDLVAGRDLTIGGTDVAAGGDIALLGGESITIEAVQDSSSLDTEGRRGRTRFDRQESSLTNIGSSVVAGGDIAVATPGDLTVSGSDIAARGDLAVNAGSINVEGVVDSYTLDETTREKRSGLLSSTRTTVTTNIVDETAIASTLEGQNVQIGSLGDTRIAGSNVVADDELAIIAGGNVTITGVETRDVYDVDTQVKKSGISIGSGGLFIGSARNSVDSDTSTTTNNGSLVGSASGDVVIGAGGSLAIEGSQVVTPGDITLSARAITIENATDVEENTTVTESSSFGLSIGAQSPVFASAANARDAANIAASTDSPRVQAVAGAAAALGAVNTVDAAENLADTIGSGTGELGIELTASLGISRSESTDTTRDETVVPSLVSGGDVTILADGAGEQSTIDVTGSIVEATGDLALAAEGAIALQSAQERDTASGSAESSGLSIGVGVGGSLEGGNVTAVAPRAFANFSSSSSSYEGEDVTNVESRLSAGDTATITTPDALTLEGAQLSANRVEVDAGSLDIISQQDTSTFTSDATSVGVGVSVSPGGAVSVSGNYSDTDMDGEFASVREQSGVFAGEGGFGINVDGATNLEGGVIASKADPENNRLATGSLAISDIENVEEYSASQIGVSASLSGGLNRSGDAESGEGQVPGTEGEGLNAGLPSFFGAEGSQDGTTRSAIAAGTIIVGGEDRSNDLAINRDTATANDGALIREFDEGTRANISDGFVAAGLLAAETQTFFANRAREEADKKAEADSKQEMLDNGGYLDADGNFVPLSDEERALFAAGVETEGSISNLRAEAAEIKTTFGTGSTLRLVAVALNGAAGADVSGSLGSLVQGTAANILQGLGAQQIKALADGLGEKRTIIDEDGKATTIFTPTTESELLRGVLQGIAGCGAGAAGASTDCSSAALGASASVAINLFINSLEGNERSATYDENGNQIDVDSEGDLQHSRNVTTLIGLIVEAAGFDASSAAVAAQIETENNANRLTGQIARGEPANYTVSDYIADETLADLVEAAGGEDAVTAYWRCISTEGAICQGETDAQTLALDKAMRRLWDLNADRDNMLDSLQRSGLDISALSGLPYEELAQRYKALEDAKIQAALSVDFGFLAMLESNPEAFQALPPELKAQYALAYQWKQENYFTACVASGPAGCLLSLDTDYQLGTRALGTAQAVLGGLGAAASFTAAAAASPACVTIAGCAPTVGLGALGVLEVDQAIAGVRTLVNGEQVNSFAAQGVEAATGGAISADNAEIIIGGVAFVGSITASGKFVLKSAPNRTSIETSNGALVRPVDSPNYSVATEVQLPSDAYPGVSRRRHNQISNQALHEAFEANPAYAAQMENLYPGIVDGVRPGPRGAFPRDAPTPDVTWHHGTTPGQMQLVPFDQHTAPGPVQGSLHPGPNSGGGFADWGTE